jgi:hypothetical protein
MNRALLLRPRPVPNRILPIAAGGSVIALALPVFLVTGWRVGGWALAAVLWLAGQSIAYLLGRLRTGMSHLAASGVVAFGMMFRAVAVLVVLVAVAVGDPKLALAAALVYALAYTLELAASLASYFGGSAR